MQIKNVAFIGTGIMGARIAGHLMDAGYDLTVYNRTREKAEALLAKGAHWAESPAAAAAHADVVFTMVGYPTDVEDVYLSTDGLIRAAKKGAWLIDLTTSSPQLARDIHDAAEVEDKHAFDCPVTGGEQGAIDGTLTLIIGAAEKDVEPVMPLLECFSSRRFFFDQPGGGQTAKLCNQVSLASCMVGYADALALAEQSGIDAEKVLEVMASGTGGSGASKTLAPKSLAGDYKPGFLAEHLCKDIALALQRSEDLDITLPGAETAFTLFDMLCQIGGSRMGTQALTLLYQEEGTCAAAGLDWSLLEQGDEDGEGCGCGCDHDHDHECGCGHDHDHGDHESAHRGPVGKTLQVDAARSKLEEERGAGGREERVEQAHEREQRQLPREPAHRCGAAPLEQREEQRARERDRHADGMDRQHRERDRPREERGGDGRVTGVEGYGSLGGHGRRWGVLLGELGHVEPGHHVAGGKLVLGAADLGHLAVDLEHPAAHVAKVTAGKAVDALDVHAVLGVRGVDVVGGGNERVVGSGALGELNLRRGLLALTCRRVDLHGDLDRGLLLLAGVSGVAAAGRHRRAAARSDGQREHERRRAGSDAHEEVLLGRSGVVLRHGCLASSRVSGCREGKAGPAGVPRRPWHSRVLIRSQTGAVFNMT